jgi:hypothetical protein
MKASDAFNVFLAQVELRGDMPFTITSRPESLITTPEQGKLWDHAQVHDVACICHVGWQAFMAGFAWWSGASSDIAWRCSVYARRR